MTIYWGGSHIVMQFCDFARVGSQKIRKMQKNVKKLRKNLEKVKCLTYLCIGFLSSD